MNKEMAKDFLEKMGVLESLVQYQFRNPELAHLAITHSSYSNERAGRESKTPPNNERLEFLGDAVIGLVIAQRLMDLFSDANEGTLSRWRSSLVSRKTLAEIALEINVGEALLLGKGEKNTGGTEKRSILAGALEAIIGALYLDAGLEKANEFIEKIYESRIDSLFQGDEKTLKKMTDKKTRLQELTQGRFKLIPEYRVVESWGPEHEKQFKVEIVIGEKALAVGEGHSKKEAEQNAANIALEILEEWIVEGSDE